MSSPRPIWRRPADAFYLVFALVHLFAGVLVDAQVFLPRHHFPPSLTNILDDYIRDSGDPLMRGALSYTSSLGGGKPSGNTWFQTSLFLELVFQNPAYLVWVWGLVKDDARIYPLMLAHSTLAFATTVQVLASYILELSPQLTAEQLRSNVAINAVWAVVPLVVALDVGTRLTRIVGRANAEGERRKRQ